MSLADVPLGILGSTGAGVQEAHILVVDDDEVAVAMLEAMLPASYKVEAALGGREALNRLDAGLHPDLVLLDLVMPDVDGHRVLQYLRSTPAVQDVPVVLVTGCTDMDLASQCLTIGAADFLPKPLNRDLLLQKVAHHVHNKAAHAALAAVNASLLAELQQLREANAALEMACMVVPLCLTALRDPDTGGHMRRTQGYLLRLVDRLRAHADHAPLLTDGMVRQLQIGAALHDIGKVGLPDHVLLKAGRFTPEEREVMETHSSMGGDAIASAQRILGPTGDFLQVAQDMARFHHERWDGTGYPQGLAGKAIPLAARMMAVVDVFDALLSKRIYKSPMDIDAARDVMALERGGLFDPEILDVFLADYASYVEIATSCPEGGCETTLR